jgi:hypothetical protein
MKITKIPKPKKLKASERPCKECGKGKRYQGRTKCYKCLRSEARAKKQASIQRARERKLNSKGYYNEQVKNLEKECDKLWSLVVRQGCQCEYTGQKGDIKEFDAHHLIRRACKATRWDVNNGVCLLKRVHRFEVHMDTFTAGDLLKVLEEKRGKEWKTFLNIHKNVIYKPTLEAMQKIKKYLQTKLEELCSNSKQQ